VLSWAPVEIGRNCDAGKTVVFDRDDRFLIDAVLEAGAKPGVDVAWNIDGCCGDKVVPEDLLKLLL
jgi:hypothetical protein